MTHTIRNRCCIIATTMVSGLLLASCTHLHIEFDRMSGTAYPADQTVSGSTVSLESIYDTLWTSVTVDEDTTNITPLTGPFDPADPDQYDYITEAELDTVEAANRTSPVGTVSCGNYCTQYHLYGVVVDHYYEDSFGTRWTGVLGIMWTSNTRAFAMFYKNGTVQGDAGKYLRSVAHEVGHAHNMHHGDGDGSMTIMNQTKTVGNTYNYAFSTDSTTHWQNHANSCKRPGIATFGGVDAAHTDHGWTTVSCP